MALQPSQKLELQQEPEAGVPTVKWLEQRQAQKLEFESEREPASEQMECVWDWGQRRTRDWVQAPVLSVDEQGWKRSSPEVAQGGRQDDLAQPPLVVLASSE